jgi:hypothetical protein
MIPHIAQKQAIAVDTLTASHPVICRFFGLNISGFQAVVEARIFSVQYQKRSTREDFIMEF